MSLALPDEPSHEPGPRARLLPSARSQRPPLAVRRWLLVIWALVFAMVVVGGITRLTGSGLSIVHWKPITGALPPLSEHDWQAVFDQYRSTPQFREVNAWMSLADFKRIFFWEYVHRLLGRAIGFAVLVPFLVFAWQRRISRALAGKVAIAFVLGGLQGLLGWYMVKSGLVDEPRVSHYRLASHLLLAFATGSFVLWTALDLRPKLHVGEAIARRGQHSRSIEHSRGPLWAAIGLGVLALLQCVFGAFMAGTHAGFYAATFPDMNGRYAPASFFTGPSLWLDAVSNPLAIHWLHRVLAASLLVYAIAFAVWMRSRSQAEGLRGAALLTALAVFVQFNLGAMTVISRVAIPWAVVHQAVAYLVVSSTVLLVHRLHAARVDARAA